MSSRNTGTPTERHATVVQNAGQADQKSVKPHFPYFDDAHVNFKNLCDERF